MKSTKPMRRDIHGVLLLNKPLGITSNRALQRIKHLFAAKKAGHTGSLDPLASGLLPICFGRATKLTGFLLNADKCYEVSCRFGVSTTTGDGEGEIVSEASVENLNRAEIEKSLPQFRGDIMQVPSMYSAVKVNGRPLYEYARKGIEVERQSRPITIFKMDLLDYEDGNANFIVHCSKGTYIRTLISDLGDVLGVGATVTRLHRVRVGNFSANNMHDMDALLPMAEEGFQTLDKVLLPLESIILSWPTLVINELSVMNLKQGECVRVAESDNDGLVRLLKRDGRLFGVGEVIHGSLYPRHIFNERDRDRI